MISDQQADGINEKRSTSYIYTTILCLRNCSTMIEDNYLPVINSLKEGLRFDDSSSRANQ